MPPVVHLQTVEDKGRSPADEVSTGSATDFLPAEASLPKLRKAAAGCRGCRLWTVGTQTVFGEGPATARVLVVGEQPGDSEDREGRPFVGPAGRMLDGALEAAGIDRGEVYVTNAVKHFKWEKREGTKRRIHKKPSDREVRACFPWLDREIELLRPDVVICLGATAAQALLGKDFRVTQQRGRAIPTDRVATVFTTVHPSSVLRAPPDAREAAEREFYADVRKVGEFLAKQGRATERPATSRARDREVARAVTPAADATRARGRRPATGVRARSARRPRGEA